MTAVSAHANGYPPQGAREPDRAGTGSEANRLLGDVDGVDGQGDSVNGEKPGAGMGGAGAAERRDSAKSSASQRDATAGTRRIPAFVIIPIWIALSSGVILINKYIFTDLSFPYPVFMTAYHMTVATIGTRILQRLPFERLQAKPIDMSWPLFCQTILPLGGLFSASLILSNMAYVHLSVSFVQMLKAFIPILTLVIQLIAGLQGNHFLLAIVAFTASGCMIAAAGELRFSLFGFSCQAAAVVVESVRLVLIQVIFRNYKLDPLSSIAMYAPICIVLISACLPFTEGLAPFQHIDRVGYPLLLVNGLVAFALNVVGMFLIDSAGSLVLTLSGVLKDTILVTAAWLLGSYITMMQVIGYSIALSGLLMFRLTNGSAESPFGQRVVRAFQAIIDVPRSLASRASRTHVRIAGLVVFASVILASWWMLDEWREGAAMVDWASLRPGHVAGGGAAGSVARARAKVRASLD